MKCAKCGHEVDPGSPACPYCASGAEPEDTGRPPSVRCPVCGSTQLDTVQKTYDPGCGCLGLLFFSWAGLLLGFLGGGDMEVVCRNCGAHWPAGKPWRARNRGCLTLVLLAVISGALAAVLNRAGR